MSRILATLLSAAAMLGACAQTATYINATKANDYGLVYSLPQTVLDITVETEHTVRTPGELANYAKLYLNIADAITVPQSDAAIKSITIVPRGVPNEANRWMMQFKPGQAVYVVLNDAEVPVAINTDPAEPKPAPALPVAQKAKPTPLETPAARQAITQEMTMCSTTSKYAQLASERIFELRENRNDLISGQAENTPPDGASMQLALDNLSAQEAALTAMFAGTEKRWTTVRTLTYVPDSVGVKNVVFARLSPTEGLVDASDLTGQPIYISMEVLTEGKIPEDEKGAPKPFPKNGIAYNIPGSARFTISYGNEVLASQTFDIAQLGVAYGIDPKLFAEKKNPFAAQFSPVTGAITVITNKPAE